MEVGCNWFTERYVKGAWTNPHVITVVV